MKSGVGHGLGMHGGSPQLSGSKKASCVVIECFGSRSYIMVFIVSSLCKKTRFNGRATPHLVFSMGATGVALTWVMTDGSGSGAYKDPGNQRYISVLDIHFSDLIDFIRLGWAFG
jgi:hypothetical protein